MITLSAVRKNKPAKAVKFQNEISGRTTVSQKGEITKEKLTKTAYTAWANDHRLLKKGGRTYTIPAGAHFTKIQERCPFGQGYAEVTFSREEALKFYPYQELPAPGETLKVVIPHDFLYITPRKGSWKGECR